MKASVIAALLAVCVVDKSMAISLNDEPAAPAKPVVQAQVKSKDVKKDTEIHP